jgi:hypothetical protein
MEVWFMAFPSFRFLGVFVLLTAVPCVGLAFFHILCEKSPDRQAIQAAENSHDEKRTSPNEGRPCKAVRVNGVEFCAMMPTPLRVPAYGEAREIDIQMKISNGTDKTIVVSNAFHFAVTTASGKALRLGKSKNEYHDDGSEDSVVIEPGKDSTIYNYSTLEWTADGKSLRLTGMKGTDFVWFDDLRPGDYLLWAKYDWDGVRSVKAEPVRFKVIPTLAGLKQSKPVSVQSIDFQAVTEPKVALVRKGERPITFGLKITNHSKKLWYFNLFDTRQIRLRNEAGKEIEGSYEREETDYTSPAIVAPGKSETVLYLGTIEPDEKNTYLLSVYESGGDWTFEGLIPGKYFLSIGYENTREILNGYLCPFSKEKAEWFWFGDVWTEEVELVIEAPPQNSTGK